MDRSLKALSLVLSYPSPELQEAMPEIGRVMADDGPLRETDPAVAPPAGGRPCLGRHV